jgi:hypothetical protein
MPRTRVGFACGGFCEDARVVKRSAPEIRTAPRRSAMRGVLRTVVILIGSDYGQMKLKLPLRYSVR